MRMPCISYHGCPIYETRVCTSVEEITECQELMYVLLTGSYYGARNVDMIREWLGPIENHVYAVAVSALAKPMAKIQIPCRRRPVSPRHPLVFPFQPVSPPNLRLTQLPLWCLIRL